MRSQFLIAKGKNLDIITQAEMVEGYAPLRQDLVRATYASYLVELLDRFTAEHDRHPVMYELIANALGWLADGRDVMLVARYYELHLLSRAGFQPQLFQCVGCAEPVVEQDQFFSAELGGFLCPDCRERDRRAVAVTAVAVKVLRYLQTRNWETVRVLQLKLPLHHQLETIMHDYIIYTLERDLKSVDFLRRLRQEAALFMEEGD